MFRHQRVCGWCPCSVVRPAAGVLYSYWGRLGSDAVWSGRCIHFEGTCCFCLQGYCIRPKLTLTLQCVGLPPVCNRLPTRRACYVGVSLLVYPPLSLLVHRKRCVASAPVRDIRKLFHTFRPKSCAVLNVTSCRFARACLLLTWCVVLTAVLFCADNGVYIIWQLCCFCIHGPLLLVDSMYHNNGVVFIYTINILLITDSNHHSSVVFIYTIHILLIRDSNQHNDNIVFTYTPRFVDNLQYVPWQQCCFCIHCAPPAVTYISCISRSRVRPSTPARRRVHYKKGTEAQPYRPPLWGTLLTTPRKL